MSRRNQSTVPPGYVEDLSKGRMLRFEASLPRLPVPSLAETGARYLKSVHPLLSAEEYARTAKAVETFVRPGGEGEPLQARLLARAADPKQPPNWLYEWWNQAAYLAYRDPVVPYVSYFYSYRDDRARRNPASRAAAIVTSVLDFKKAVDARDLEPEYLRKEPMAMLSYQYMFNTTRMPARPADYPAQFPPQENQHIAVLRKNAVYKLPTHVDGKQLTTAEFALQFKRILEATDKGPAAPPVGVLTGVNRDIWTDARAALEAASPANKAVLNVLDSSSFVVCLDAAAPITLEERAHQFWHGDGRNRWFDKPLQFIINDNGTAGFMGEHSMMDGTPTHRLNDQVNRLITTNALDYSNPAVRPNLGAPERFDFVVNGSLTTTLAEAEKLFDATFAEHELAVQAFQAYGKGLIKKFGCSPDAYVQMLIQLAYFKMYGTNRPTYESASTRRFQLGRTETARTVSDDSVAFCRAMTDPAVPRAEVVSKLRAALAAHVKYVSDASVGHGVDRHLFGLKKTLTPGEPLPALYQDPAYAYSGSWYISSSQLSSEYFNGYGWSQVIDDGFGIAYMINEESLQFNIVCKKLGAQRMSYYLNEAALEMKELLMPELKEKEKAKL